MQEKNEKIRKKRMNHLTQATIGAQQTVEDTSTFPFIINSRYAGMEEVTVDGVFIHPASTHIHMSFAFHNSR